MLRFGILGIVGALLLAGGCVSSSQHDDLTKKYLEEEAKSRRLAADNAKLTAALQGKKVDVGKILNDLSALDQPTTGGGRPFTPVAGDVQILKDGGLRLGGLNFRSGSADLTEQGRATLDQVAAQLKAKPGFILVVDGHTDTDPIHKSPHASNWELSGKRAAAVLDHLVKAGVCDGQNAFLRGYGEFRAISPDKAKNRRVEIYAFDAPGLAGGSNVKAPAPETEPVAPPPTRPAPKPPVNKDPTLK